MRVTAKADYAVRAAVEIAAAGDGPVKGETISRAQDIPVRFLENILGELRHAGLVRSQRGAEGGYWLARPPAEIAIADIIRAVEGPLASVRSEPPENLEYSGSAESLRTVWLALRVNIRAVLETVTLADIVAGVLPADVTALLNLIAAASPPYLPLPRLTPPADTGAAIGAGRHPAWSAPPRRLFKRLQRSLPRRRPGRERMTAPD